MSVRPPWRAWATSTASVTRPQARACGQLLYEGTEGATMTAVTVVSRFLARVFAASHSSVGTRTARTGGLGRSGIPLSGLG